MVIRVDPDKIAYMAVPKAACSSIKASLAALDPTHPVDDPTQMGQKEVHAFYATHRFRKHRWMHLDDYFRFTVVRDPLKRLMGVYTNRVVGLRELYNCRKIKRGRVDLPADPDPDFFFQNLEGYIDISSSIKHHALPTALFTGRRFDVYTKVYKTNEINALSADLSAHVGREVVIPHFNSSDQPLSLDDLKPETHRVLKQRLAAEYTHLARFFDNPLERVAA